MYTIGLTSTNQISTFTCHNAGNEHEPTKLNGNIILTTTSFVYNRVISIKFTNHNTCYEKLTSLAISLK